MNLTIFPISPINSNVLDNLEEFWQSVDAIVIQCLYDELNLENKPGLVCPSSNGSHSDMNYHTFIASIESLKGYFALMCRHGYDQCNFATIQQAGVAQEVKMRIATGNINTHKGAIFNLGFCCLAVGRCIAHKIPLTITNICQQLIQNWQMPIRQQLPRQANSHGQQMYQKYGLPGAIELVSSGFELVQQKSLPCYYHIFARTHNFELAATQTLMTLIAHLADTNIAWRGGLEGLEKAQSWATAFLANGGVFQTEWEFALQQICQYFIQANLSPGGSADLLAVTSFFFRIEHEFSDFI